KRTVANYGTVFPYAIIIAGDRTCSHVHSLSQRCVANIAKVMHRRLLANIGIFHFPKITHMYITSEIGPVTTMAERPDTYAIFKGCLFKHRLAHNAAVPKRGVLNARSWPDAAGGANVRVASNHGT